MMPTSSLRVCLLSSTDFTPRHSALGDREKAESKCIKAKLKLDQMLAKLHEVQEARRAMLTD